MGGGGRRRETGGDRKWEEMGGNGRREATGDRNTQEETGSEEEVTGRDRTRPCLCFHHAGLVWTLRSLKLAF